ncbi:MAG: DNA repair protein RecO [Magnetospirillum gryphiswaldense]|nr:DNA repair protein RecO [Magnetospirillum gryphiswaldense]
MSEWTDDAIVLSARKLGESGVVASLLTHHHGRHPGMVPGGAGKALRPVLQPGNAVQAVWRGRLEDHLGTYRLELAAAHSARHLDDPSRLAALGAACALCEAALPERQPHGPVFEALSALLAAMAASSWPSVYVHWELALLRDLGFGLDLSSCAATGSTDELIYVSPKSARAVSAQAGRPYAHKLLKLPGFLLDGKEGQGPDIADGLELTGYFLERHVLGSHHKAMPAARTRLVDRFRSSSKLPGSKF